MRTGAKRFDKTIQMRVTTEMWNLIEKKSKDEALLPSQWVRKTLAEYFNEQERKRKRKEVTG